MSSVIDKIRLHGYWKVVARPCKFKKDRIPDIAGLLPLLQKCAVQLRGWDIPHIKSQKPPRRYEDWIESEIEFMGLIEIWRFYQSGLFVHLSSIQLDWIDPKEFTKNIWVHDNDKLEGPLLGIIDTVFHFTEIFEFISRLANTEAGDEQMYVEITLYGLNGRRLFVDDYMRAPLFQSYVASIENYGRSEELPRTRLIAETKELALTSSAELFKRFGWDTKLDLLRNMQSQLYRR